MLRDTHHKTECNIQFLLSFLSLSSSFVRGEIAHTNHNHQAFYPFLSEKIYGINVLYDNLFMGLYFSVFGFCLFHTHIAMHQ